MTGRRLDFICMSEINGEKQLFREAIKMIYITGDTHGEFGRRFNTQNFPEQKTMTKDDYVIICGDFGGIWDFGQESKNARHWIS